MKERGRGGRLISALFHTKNKHDLCFAMTQKQQQTNKNKEDNYNDDDIAVHHTYRRGEREDGLGESNRSQCKRVSQLCVAVGQVSHSCVWL